MHHQSLEAARRAARRFFQERVAGWSPDAVSESVLLREGRVIGQQFVCRCWKLQWLAGQSQLQVFEGDREPFFLESSARPGEQKAA
jgi:hypothetical protein